MIDFLEIYEKFNFDDVHSKKYKTYFITESKELAKKLKEVLNKFEGKYTYKEKIFNYKNKNFYFIKIDRPTLLYEIGFPNPSIQNKYVLSIKQNNLKEREILKELINYYFSIYS